MASSPSAAPPRSLEGVEVPIIGSDKLKWIEVTVPAPRRSPQSPQPTQPHASPLPRSAASCHIIPGDSPAYLVWRIHENRPDALEVVELSPCREFSETGLRLIFPDALHPFSFICKNEAESNACHKYMIYALTDTGIAYVFNLRSFHIYTSGSVFPQNEYVELDVQTHSRITVIAAASGCLVIGRQDGSVGCYRLGTLDQSAPGFMIELRDDAGIGRLWNLMSRGRVVGAVQDLSISEVFERKLLFVAHLDGSFRVWDLLSNTRILNHYIVSQDMTGCTICKFWVGDANYESGQVSLAVLYDSSSESNFGTIAVYSLDFSVEDKLTLSSEPSMQYIRLDEGRLIDLKLTSDKLWILKEEGSMLYDLSCSDIETENTINYNLHEDSVAEQLFQGSEHPSDDLIWANLSTFSSAKDQVPYVISSVFLRRLLQPGIYLNSALYATMMDQKKYISETEMQSLNISGLKQEIFSIIESEGVTTNPRSMLCYWKNFCSHFLQHWCQNNMPYSLFIDSSSGIVGLIRKTSISLFRQLDGIERVIYGSSDEFRDIRNNEMILPSNDLDCEILFDVLRCISVINNQLGRASGAVIYESLANPSIISYEETICHLLELLEAGYCSSVEASLLSQVGDDVTWEKKQADHKNHRKFSVDMLLSLHSLHTKANTWGRILDVIELYLKNLLPGKFVGLTDSRRFFNINSILLVQATSQIAKTMFDCAFDMLMLLGYLANVSAEVHMVQTDLSRIKFKILPMIRDIIMHWHILHFIGTTPTESKTVEDFSSQLSSLHIGNNVDDRSWDGKLGSYGFTLAFLFDFPISCDEEGFISSSSFPSPSKFINPVWKFCSWAIWGRADDESSISIRPVIEIACLLLQHGQYEAAENLLVTTDTHLNKNITSQNFQCLSSDWCACLHLLGFCVIVRAQGAFSGVLKEWKIREAVRCFFRAASGEGACAALQNLSFQTGLLYPGSTGSTIVWKFFYFQWVMQFFEQYNLSEAACQFALAALEQVDEVLEDDNSGAELLPEPPTAIRGRLWANIFKFAIDLNHYRDAYCAIISNPDEDSKHICLRRLIIVLYERNEPKILCDGELPFVGLIEKVEQELVWKAERSDVYSRPNLHKLLYAFEICRKNWRKAAAYMHRYSIRLRKELNLNENHQLSSGLQEILCSLSASINALQLVHPSHAWIDSQHETDFSTDNSSPNKRARKDLKENSSVTVDSELQIPHGYIDIEVLEKDYVLTSAQYQLSLVNAKCTISGNQTRIEHLVDGLVQANLYDMAFTVLFKFWKGSELKRELESVFISISQKCLANNVGSSFVGTDFPHGLLLTSATDGALFSGKVDVSPPVRPPLGNSQWEVLELYLEKYRKLHPRLPVTVAETLLYSDPQIELPLWLVHIFKGGRMSASWGMTGQESDPATLCRLYVDYGRYAEATNLLLEYLENFASLRPADIVNRKKMSATWFPYVAVERLWCHLEEMQSSGHVVDQCDRLKKLLYDVLQNHLKQVKVDSDDTLASFPV